jgi:D-alanine-D-alanine ligase
VECAVLGGAHGTVSTPGEILVHHPDGFYSYAAKYLDDGATTRIPAELSAQETKTAQELAQRAFDVLACQGLARVDLFMDKDRSLYVNEINTMPGCTAVSMYPKMMAHSGVDGQQLVTHLIDDALARAASRKALRSSK